MKKKLLLASLVLVTTTCLVFPGCKKKPAENSSAQKEVTGQFGNKVKTLTAEEINEKQNKEKLAMENFGITNEMSQQLPAAAFKERTDVKYGTVKHETYYSNTCRMERPYNILLPASYDGVKKYPVVYFQHGIFGDENSMIMDDNNKIKQLAANLSADGKAKEMIFVFGHMYATDDPNQKPGFDAKAVLPYDNFLNELVNDLMPYIESHYAVLTGRDNTAVCGFSMGGRESLYIGLSRPDLFGYIGAIAPAPGLVAGKDGFMTHEGSLLESQVKFENTIPHFVMICCGTQDSVVGKFPKSYHQLFSANGIEHQWFEVAGADHNHITIRTGVYYFLQEIF